MPLLCGAEQHVFHFTSCLLKQDVAVHRGMGAECVDVKEGKRATSHPPGSLNPMDLNTGGRQKTTVLHLLHSRVVKQLKSNYRKQCNVAENPQRLFEYKYVPKLSKNIDGFGMLNHLTAGHIHMHY